MKRKPTSVPYNDWRQVAVEPLDTFKPTMPVSVIFPSYQTPAETLAMLLASLEGQTYPRELFEVIIVDDGSEPPLERLPATPLDVKVVRQERRGFGHSRARNNGAQAAAHDILLFLDSDMLVEADWMMAHARWHHVVSDVLTLGFRSHVEMDGIDPEIIRRRPGSLKELFSDRPVTPAWAENYLAGTNNLTSRADDMFSVMIGGNFGIGKDFFWSLGGNDESFVRWGPGLEDNELCYRAYTHGGLLAPVREADAWHQGSWEEGREARQWYRRILRGKAAHLIAHDSLCKSRPGRVFTVPQHVVTIDAGHHPAERIINTAGNILAGHVHDLVVRIESPELNGDTERLAWLQDEFGADPRVRVAPAGSALDEFPTSPFHVTLPADVFAKDLVHRLRAKLGDAVSATATLPDGSTVSITRTWALHRADRTGKRPADFGEARTIPAKALKLRSAGATGNAQVSASTDTIGYPTKWGRLLDKTRAVRSPADAWSFLKWLTSSLLRRAKIIAGDTFMEEAIVIISHKHRSIFSCVWKVAGSRARILLSR